MEKWVLVTGASRGIGRATVLELLDQGHGVITLSRGKHKETHKEGKVIHIGFDWESFSEIAIHIKGEIGSGRIQGLINNAGLLIKQSIEEATFDALMDQVKVNAWYPLELFRALHTQGLLSEDCHVLNIGSMGGYQGASKFPGLFSYSASKSVLATLTESMEAEYGDGRLSFNCLALGAVNTEMLQEAFPGYFSQVDPENMAKFIVSFLDHAGRIMSGKIIPVTKSDPEG